MKRNLFFISSIVFGFTLFIGLNQQNDLTIMNEAFATGTCCPETSSICITDNNGDIYNYYGKSSGSCSGGNVDEDGNPLPS